MKNITLKTAALAAAVVFCTFSAAWAIPEMRITATSEPTGNQNCTDCRYVKITNFQLTGAGNNNLSLTPESTGEADSIKVRGNSTAMAAKKPYRIKFDKKQGLFGRPAAKSWVLLANYYDQTFALNAIAFRLGHKLGLPFTPTSQFVNLYINNSYKGIYQVTEQVQVSEALVNIDPDYGYLVEFDYHDPDNTDIKFTAAQYSLGTFIKSPEINGGGRDFNVDNSTVKWVKDSVNALMNSMAASGFPTNGYRDKIDLESFAKYVLIEMFMDNFDFNSKAQTGQVPGSNYAYRDVGQKLKAGPLWDFDLSAVGYQGMGFTPHYSTYQVAIKPTHTFYQRLWSDPEFIGHFKNTWTTHKSDFTALSALVDSISTALSSSVANNVSADPANLLGGNMWGGGGQQYTLTTQVYSQEISKLKTWLGNRITFFDTEVNKLSGTPPVQPPVGGTYTLAVARNQTAGGSVSVKIGSGAAQTNPSGQLTADANTSITITATPASGYTFQNWTAVSGALPSGVTATSAAITFSIAANVNIRANFTGGTIPPGTNHTLQVSRNPNDRGSVSVTVGDGSPQANPAGSISVPSGTSVTLTAASAVSPNGNMYNFVNWTAASGALPDGITAADASITFTMSANVNIRANFQTGGTGGTTYTLTVNGNTAEGSVNINGQSYTFGQAAAYSANESITLTAAAKSGYQFLNWSAAETALPSGITLANANNASVTFTITGNVNIAANFRDNTGGAKTDTLAIVEAEDMASSNPAAVNCPANPPNSQTLCISPPNSDGVVGIGYINNGNTATYEVNMAAGGSYKLAFRVASNGQGSFRVNVNGTNMGTISANTNDWDGYTYVTLEQDAYLDAGANTIKLEFQSSINVDKFVILGAPPVGVRYFASGRTSAARTSVTLRPSPRGFTAALPANHGYTSYRLIDMRGRAVRSGKVGPGMADLRFDGLNRGVLFLRLEGGNGAKPAVLRAVTY